jgi:hypothetical protein
MPFSEEVLEDQGHERKGIEPSVPDMAFATSCQRLGTGARQFRSGGRRSAKAARVWVRTRFRGLTLSGFTMNNPTVSTTR